MNDINSKITIEQIAELAGVSIATVSRVINNKDKVKKSTKNKVLSIMEELNFHPKQNNTLSNINSNVILLCVPDFNNPFNATIIDGVQTSAHENGYDVLILQSKNYYTDTTDYENILKSNSIAGIIILSSVANNRILDDIGYKCPVVMCSEYAENYGVSYVSIDDVSSAKTAVNYLISTGCKKIGILNCNDKFKYARHRERGYREALNDAGLEINENWISNISNIDYNLALSSATSMLSQADRPDAIFACSDVFAVGAVNAAKSLGLKVPEDVSVIGFDNINLAVMCNPALTTIKQPTFQLGFQSCELLIEKIKKPNMLNKQIILNTELIVRDSTNLSK